MTGAVSYQAMVAAYPPAANAGSGAVPVAAASALATGKMATIFAAGSFPDTLKTFARLPTSWWQHLSGTQKNDLLRAVGIFPPMLAKAAEAREIWLRTLWGFAAAEADGATEARAAALMWSRTAPNFGGEAAFERDWSSYRMGAGISVGSLIRDIELCGFDLAPWRQASTSAPALASPAGGGFFHRVLFGASHLRPVPWLVRGIAVAGDISVIAAPGGGAKTMAAVDLLVCIAAGRRSWCGLRIVLRTDGQPHQVAIITAEEAPDRIALLVAAACQANQLSPVEIAAVEANLTVHDARASGFRIGQPRGRGEDICPEAEDRACIELRAALADKSLVVLDTLAATFALPNENDNSTATTLLRRLGAVLAATSCAAILLHHTPKMTREAAAGQRGEATAVRGGGAIVNSARIVWTITALPITEAGLFALTGANVAAIRRLDPVKLNDAAPPDPVFFEVASELVRIGDGSDVSVRALRATAQPSAAAGAIPSAMLNLAMRAVDAGATIRSVSGVPLSRAVTGNRSAVAHIASAFRAADPTLPEAHAKTAARDVLADLMDRLGCVTEAKVAVPKFKADGSPNGHDQRDGLVTDWRLAPWVTAPAVLPAAPVAPMAPAEAAPTVPASSPSVPATTAAP